MNTPIFNFNKEDVEVIANAIETNFELSFEDMTEEEGLAELDVPDVERATLNELKAIKTGEKKLGFFTYKVLKDMIKTAKESYRESIEEDIKGGELSGIVESSRILEQLSNLHNKLNKQ